VIALTASCAAFGHKRRAVARTWRKDWLARGGRHFFVLGDPSLPHAVLLDDCLYVPCRDDYESLLLKLALAYRFVHQSQWDFSHVLKIDDDCYLDVERFAGLLAAHGLAGADRDYLGAALQPCTEAINPRWHFGKCSDPRFDVPYPNSHPPADYAKGGYGYLLSRRALGVLAAACDTFRDELAEFRYSYEDLRIGEILAAEGMPARALPGVTLAPPSKPLGHDAVVVFDLSNPALFDRRHDEIEAARARRALQLADDPDRRQQPRRPAGFDGIYLFHDAGQAVLPGLLALHQHELTAMPVVRSAGADSPPDLAAHAAALRAVLRSARQRGQQRVLLLDAELWPTPDLHQALALLWCTLDPRCPVACLGPVDGPRGGAGEPVVPTMPQLAMLVQAEAFDALERHLQARLANPVPVRDGQSGLAALLAGWSTVAVPSPRPLWAVGHGPGAGRRPAVAVVLAAGVPAPEGDAARHGIDLLCFHHGPDGLRPAHPAPAGHGATEPTPARPLDHLRHALAIAAVELSRPASVDEVVAGLWQALVQPESAALGGPDLLRPREVVRPALKPGRASVVVPTKGRREPMELAVRSVLEQDWPDLELLLVNENPPDSEMTAWLRGLVKALAAAHPSRRIVLLQHAVPRNAAAARNTGLLAATGEFVSFLDDDDAFLPGRLSQVIAALQAQPSVEAAYCGYLGWISKENNPDRYPTHDMVWRLLALDFHSHYVCTDTVTYRTESLLAINGYDEGFVRHQDLELNVRFLSRFAIGAHPQALVRLNPLPADQANKVFDEVFFRLKQRFLAKFAREIEALGERAPAVFERHAKELRNFCREPGLYERLALEHPSRLSNEVLRTALAAAAPRPAG